MFPLPCEREYPDRQDRLNSLVSTLISIRVHPGAMCLVTVNSSVPKTINKEVDCILMY